MGFEKVLIKLMGEHLAHEKRTHDLVEGILLIPSLRHIYIEIETACEQEVQDRQKTACSRKRIILLNTD